MAGFHVRGGRREHWSGWTAWVGLVVKESIIREATWTQKSTNERLISMNFNLASKSNAIPICWGMWPDIYCVHYAGTEYVFCADLDGAASRVPSSDYLFGLIEAKDRTGI